MHPTKKVAPTRSANRNRGFCPPPLQKSRKTKMRLYQRWLRFQRGSRLAPYIELHIHGFASHLARPIK